MQPRQKRLLNGTLKHIIMVSGFEEEFGIDVDPEEAVGCTKTSRPLKIVMRKLN